MQVIRTALWVILLFALLAFSFFNWKPVEVQIWDNLILETKVPALVIVSFLLGLVPMWLLHRGAKWRYRRRITALEAAARTSVAAPAGAPEPAPRPLPADEAPAAEPLVPEDEKPKPKDDILG
jgi:hypothetical protein